MSTEATRTTAPLSGMSDGELVVALREGRNIMAFDTLLKRYQRPIFGFIRRQVGDRGRAEDLFQETFLKVYSRVDTCRDPEAFKPWVYAIAANLCRNEARRADVRRGEQPAEHVEAHADRRPDPEGAAIDAERRRQIERALQGLVPAQREVFVLYQYSRLSYEEIAQALEVPVGTVKSRMNAALTQLRGELDALRRD